MADKRITTELVVKAVDQYSGMIRNMTGVTGRFAEKVRSDMGRLQGLRGPLRLIEDFRKKQQVVRASAGALDAANEKTRQLLATIRATKNPTAAMRREFDRARATAGRLEEKHRRNRSELRGLQVQMRSAGVNTADLAGEQRRLTNALAASNTAFARQAERMQRLKVMQDRITAGRERMDRSLARSANLSFAGNSAIGVGRRILESTKTVAERSGNQQASFTEFQNLTGVDDARISQLREELSGLRDVTKQSVGEMLAGLEVLVGKGMDLEDALGALPATARAAFATSTSSDEMGGAGFALYDNLKVSPDQLSKAYDIMAMGGKEGGFELSAMAKAFPEITAGARALKMEGLDSVSQLTAALQISMKSAGSESQAANNLSNFLGKLTSPATVKKFAAAGISIEKELKKAMERGVSPMEHMLEIIEKKTGGDAMKLGKLFEDKQVLDFLRAIIPNLEEYRSIKEKALGADGVIDGDLSRKLEDFNTQKGQLGESLGNLFSLPPDVLDTMTAMMVRADAFVEKLILWKKENPAFAKGIFLGAAALGSMAVAGGAMLVTASGLLGTMAVMRFGLVGLGARGAFAAGEIGLLSTNLRGLQGLKRFALSSLLTPVRWVGGLIPSVPWARRAGVLRWSSLIRPLAWIGRGAMRFIPVIGWAALAGELAWRFLIKPLGWDAYLPTVDWSHIVGSLSWRDGVPVIDWSEFIQSFGWGEKITAINWGEFLSPVHLLEWVKTVDWTEKITAISWSVFVPIMDIASFVPKLLWYNIVEPLGWDKYVPSIDWGYWFNFSWVNHLPAWSWDFITEFDMAGLITWPDPPNWLKWLMGQEAQEVEAPLLRELPGFDGADPKQAALETVELFSPQAYGESAHALPAPAHLQELRDHAAALREEIASIQGEIDNLGQGPMAATMAMPHQQTMDARKRDLQEVEAELASSELMSGRLTSALQVLDGTEATPEINAASIDRALEKVARLSASLRSMPGASAGSGPPVRPAGARAFGGSVRAGLPYRVNEHTPKSEWFVPSASGGILNVGQAQSAFMSHFGSSAGQGSGVARGAQRVRSASMAALAASALVGSAAAAAGGGASGKSMSARVEIGSISIVAPSGVSDPRGLVDLIKAELGQEVEAAFSASFSD